MAGYKTRKTWSAPDIQFDATGKRIRPEAVGGACPCDYCQGRQPWRMGECHCPLCRNRVP